MLKRILILLYYKVKNMGFFLLCVIIAAIGFVMFVKLDCCEVATILCAIGCVAVIIAIVLLGMAVGTTTSDKAFHDRTVQERADYITVLESDEWYNKDDAVNLIADILEWNSDLVARDRNVHNFMIKGLVNNTSDIETIDLSKYLPVTE